MVQVPSYILLLIFFIVISIVSLLIHSFVIRQNQFAATSSVLSQIWSGNCDRTCPNNGTSTAKPIPGGNQRTCNHEGTSRDQDCACAACPCGACPCAIVCHILQSYKPALKFYESINRDTMEFYNDVKQWMNDLYEYFTRALECRSPCVTNRTELVRNNNFAASEQFLFREQEATLTNPENFESRAQTAQLTEPLPPLMEIKSSTVAFRSSSAHDSKIELSTSTIDVKSKELLESKQIAKYNEAVEFNETIESKEPVIYTPPHSSSLKSVCQRCIETGEKCGEACNKENK